MSSKQPPTQPEEEDAPAGKPSLKEFSETRYGKPRVPAENSVGYPKPRGIAYTGPTEDRSRPRLDNKKPSQPDAQQYKSGALATNEKSSTQISQKPSQKLSAKSSQKLKSNQYTDDEDDGVGPDVFRSAVDVPEDQPCFINRITTGLTFTQILGYIIFFIILWYVVIIFASCLKTQLQKEFHAFFVYSKHPKN